MAAMTPQCVRSARHHLAWRGCDAVRSRPAYCDLGVAASPRVGLRSRGDAAARGGRGAAAVLDVYPASQPGGGRTSLPLAWICSSGHCAENYPSVGAATSSPPTRPRSPGHLRDARCLSDVPACTARERSGRRKAASNALQLAEATRRASSLTTAATAAAVLLVPQASSAAASTIRSPLGTTLRWPNDRRAAAHGAARVASKHCSLGGTAGRHGRRSGLSDTWPPRACAPRTSTGLR